MDEFANVSLPDDFDKILSVMRSREVSVSIISVSYTHLVINYAENPDKTKEQTNQELI